MLHSVRQMATPHLHWRSLPRNTLQKCPPLLGLKLYMKESIHIKFSLEFHNFIATIAIWLGYLRPYSQHIFLCNPQRMSFVQRQAFPIHLRVRLQPTRVEHLPLLANITLDRTGLPETNTLAFFKLFPGFKSWQG